MTVGKWSVVCWTVFVIMSVAFLPGLALAAAIGDQVPILGIPAAVGVIVLWWGPFVYAMYLSQVVMRRGDPRLRKRGLRAPALVLEAARTNTVIQEGEFEWQAPFVYKYHLRVTLPGKEPYDTWCRICMAGIRQGQTVEVAVSPLNRKRVTIIPDSAQNAQDDQVAQMAALEGLASAATAPAPSSGLVSPLPSSPDDARLHDLERLGELHERGVLTDAEFAAEKARILRRP